MNVKSIGLDYDIPIGKFNKKKFMALVEKVPHIEEIYYRRSPGGNVHVKLYPVIPMPLFKSIQVRAYMGDDAWRVYGDLKRLYQYGDQAMFDVLFDENFKGQWRQAGEWRELRLFH